MTFKDHVAADLSAVFLNTAEFADTIIFQGMPVTAVASRNATAAFDAWRRRTHEELGVGMQLLTLCLPVNAVDQLYPEDEVSIDGLNWSVLTTEIDDGMLTIHLYRHEA